MTNDKKKVETGETMTEVAQRAKENAAGLEAVGKSLSELLKNVTMIQNSAASTHALAEKNLKSIQENSEDIESIKEKTGLLQERQDHQGRGLDECLARMDALERNQSLFRTIVDQDLKISQLERKISTDEFRKGSCIITMHGLPLPKSISEMNIGDPADINTIANTFMEGLGKDTAEFIFASNEEGGFTNMAGWAQIPDNDNYKFSARAPETSKNSVIFYFRDRIQTIKFEAKIRGSLIATQASRKAGDFGFLEMSTYAESSRVRALKSLMMYKGKLLVDNLPQFSGYRVAWRGGASRSSHGPAKLTLELRASKVFMEETRKEYFFDEEGTMIRNAWSDQSNIKLSEPDQTWFPRKPEINLRAEAKVVSKTTPKLKPTLKRSRESPGLAGNAAKLPGSFKCKDCDKVFRSKVGLSEHNKEKHVNELNQAGEDVTNVEEDSDNETNEFEVEAQVTAVRPDEILEVEDNDVGERNEGEDDEGFVPPSTKKEKKLAGRKSKIGFKGAGTTKAPSFTLHAPIPDLNKQKKITASFASVSKKSTPTIANSLPVPKIFSTIGE